MLIHFTGTWARTAGKISKTVPEQTAWLNSENKDLYAVYGGFVSSRKCVFILFDIEILYWLEHGDWNTLQLVVVTVRSLAKQICVQGSSRIK
jgi:hypothetical protein